MIINSSHGVSLGVPAVQAGRVFRDCPECPEMVIVPAGRFTMGSSEADTARDLAAVDSPYIGYAQAAAAKNFATEHPQHLVTIDSSFALGKYVITRGEFAVFVNESHYQPDAGCTIYINHKYINLLTAGWQDPGFAQTDVDPVLCLSRQDAESYIAWLNSKLINSYLTSTGGSYALPTEAEWEYAARAGTQTARWWGDSIGSGNANCTNCGSKWDNIRVAPVGSFRPNPFGLHEMLGNVWQWTADCWHEDYQGAPDDGGAWISGSCDQSVARGGGWGSDAFGVRSAERTHFENIKRFNFVGFRIKKTLQ